MKRTRIKQRVRIRIPTVEAARPAFSILDAIDQVFADWFTKRASWKAWFVFLRALFALPMSEKQLAIYRECTGRNDPPEEAAIEA